MIRFHCFDEKRHWQRLAVVTSCEVAAGFCRGQRIVCRSQACGSVRLTAVHSLELISRADEARPRRRMSKMTRTGSATTDSRLQGLRRKTSAGRTAAGPELARTHSAPLSHPAPVGSRFGRSAADGEAPRFGSPGRVQPRSGLGMSSGAGSPLSTASSASFASSWPPGNALSNKVVQQCSAVGVAVVPYKDAFESSEVPVAAVMLRFKPTGIAATAVQAEHRGTSRRRRSSSP